MANVSESLGAQFPMRTTSVSKDPVSPLSRGALSRPSALRRVSHASATLPPGAGRGGDPVRRTAARRAVIDHHAAWNTLGRVVGHRDQTRPRGWVEREPLVQRSRPEQQRARERLRVRGDQLRMSALGTNAAHHSPPSTALPGPSSPAPGPCPDTPSTHLVEVIGASGQELTYIIRAAYRPTETSFITPPELKQQVGYDVYPTVRRSHGTPTG